MAMMIIMMIIMIIIIMMIIMMMIMMMMFFDPRSVIKWNWVTSYQVEMGHKLSNESISQVIKWNWVTSYQMKVGHKLSSKPAMMLAIVDLPLPGGPLMKTCKIVALEYRINL